MTSEGKLIREVKNLIYEENEPWDVPDLIKEAKKEFPIWDNDDGKASFTREVIVNLVKNKDKWFLKWFGKL